MVKEDLIHQRHFTESHLNRLIQSWVLRKSRLNLISSVKEGMVDGHACVDSVDWIVPKQLGNQGGSLLWNLSQVVCTKFMLAFLDGIIYVSTTLAHERKPTEQ